MSLFFLLNPKRQQSAWQFDVGKKVKEQIEKIEPALLTIDEPDDEEERRKFLRARKKKTTTAIQAIIWGLDL